MRYLIPFHPKRHPHFFTDILVIGGGLAGLRTALAVDPQFQVLLICKDGLENSNSMHAQGGIAAVRDANDSIDAHIEDTLTAGGNLDKSGSKMYNTGMRELSLGSTGLFGWTVLLPVLFVLFLTKSAGN